MTAATLPADLEAFVREEVAAGRHADAAAGRFAEGGVMAAARRAAGG
jgi:hypothetical protein